MLSTIVSAAAAALSVPLTPAPARQHPPCAVYRYYPAGSDGAKQNAVFTVRVFASTVETAAMELGRLRRALVNDGDMGQLGDAQDPYLVRETAQYALSGYVRGSGIYFLQAGFTISGRA